MLYINDYHKTLSFVNHSMVFSNIRCVGYYDKTPSDDKSDNWFRFILTGIYYHSINDIWV